MLVCCCASGLKRDALQLPRLLQGLTQLQWLSLADDDMLADEVVDQVSLVSQSRTTLACCICRLPVQCCRDSAGFDSRMWLASLGPVSLCRGSQ